jgi:hypothetical protein
MQRSWRALVFPALVALVGCYLYTPAQGAAPPVGQTVLLSVSDRGRVELRERLGPGVSSIEARVADMEGDQLTLNVYGVKYISGESSRWSGESMRLNRDLVEQLWTRRLSKKRTWIAAGSAAVVITAFIATRGLLGLFTGDRDEPPPPPPSSFRLRLSLP